MMRRMRLFVGNLPWAFSSEDLARLFSEYGEVERARVIKDRVSGRSRGFGFVEMRSARHGSAAVSGLNGANVGGRQLTVNEARARVSGHS
jgi:RNA recognition motif-containing protein